MNKLLLLAAAAVLLSVGCHGTNGGKDRSAKGNRTAMSPDEEIIQDAADAGGIVVSDKYTMPTTAADRKAKPDDILYDESGEPYRVVKKLGMDDKQ